MVLISNYLGVSITRYYDRSTKHITLLHQKL